MKKISIISVFYNDVKMMKKTMDSVLSQTYTNYEHIIIDGGSTDGSKELLEEYIERYNGKLRYVSEPDEGIYDALNKGLKMMTGGYYLGTTDPFLYTNSLQILIDKLTETKADFVSSGMLFLDDENRIIRLWSGKSGNWRLGWMAASPTMLMTKSVSDKVGFYKVNYKTASDYERQIRIFKDKSIKIVTIKKPLVLYLAGGTSNGGIKGNIISIKESYRALKENNVKFAWFTTLCKILIAFCAYLFAPRKKVDINELENL